MKHITLQIFTLEKKFNVLLILLLINSFFFSVPTFLCGHLRKNKFLAFNKPISFLKVLSAETDTIRCVIPKIKFIKTLIQPTLLGKKLFHYMRFK